jgi:hypothetical protein
MSLGSHHEHEILVISGLDEDLLPAEDQLGATELFQFHVSEVRAVKTDSLFYVSEGNTDLKMNKLSERHTSSILSQGRRRYLEAYNERMDEPLKRTAEYNLHKYTIYTDGHRPEGIDERTDTLRHEMASY